MAHGDILVSVRNNLDSAWQSRQIARPASGDLGLFLFTATPGDPVAATLGDGFTYDDITGVIDVSGSAGADGKSAYEIAVDNDFVGTVSEWLDSLVGPSGDDGKSAYEIASQYETYASEEDWLDSLKGEKGDNAHIDIASNVSRPLNTSFIISEDRVSQATYSVSMSTAITAISASASGTAYLEYTTNGTTWVTVSKARMKRTTGLSVSVGEVNEIDGLVTGFIPAGATVRIRAESTGGATGTITYITGQEVLF